VSWWLARLLGREGRGERMQPRFLGPRASDRAGQPQRGGLVERRIAPQAGDRSDAVVTHSVEEQ